MMRISHHIHQDSKNKKKGINSNYLPLRSSMKYKWFNLNHFCTKMMRNTSHHFNMKLLVISYQYKIEVCEPQLRFLAKRNHFERKVSFKKNIWEFDWELPIKSQELFFLKLFFFETETWKTRQFQVSVSKFF